MAYNTVVFAATLLGLILALFPVDASASAYNQDNPTDQQPGHGSPNNRLPVQKDVAPIWCFQCNSQYDEKCAGILPNDTSSVYYRQCVDDDQSRKTRNGREFFCRKIVQKIFDRDGIERIVRKCGYVVHDRLPCYSYTSEGHNDIVCQCFSDACNSAPQLTSPLMTALSGIAVVFMTSRFI